MARTEDAALARHIDPSFPELDTLFEAGEQAQMLLEHPGFARVQALIDAEARTLNAEMGRATRPLEQADYALRHGRLGALTAFRDAAETLVARAEKRRKEQAAQHEGSTVGPER